MSSSELIQSVEQLRGRKIDSFGSRAEPKDALLCMPDYYDVIDVKNPHMAGNVGNVDKNKALLQWTGVRDALVKAGTPVRLIPPLEGLEDMVFTANQVLPGRSPTGEKICLLSNMRYPSRKKEVPAFEEWFRARGYHIERLSRSDWLFEGQGDALWHPMRQCLWGGYGLPVRR